MKTMPDITRQAAHDQCDRCGGLMILEWIGDLGMEGECWRCVICGERLDPVILAHRRDRTDET
jgi:hypothetical protein